MSRFYLVWGVLWLLFFGWYQFTGVGHVSTDEVKGVPKSIRDNPGAYRSHYIIGGK